MKTIKAEFKHIKSQKMLLAAILAIMFIPFLYSVFFLKSVWNPYGDAKYLPVAVVNEDRAVNFRGKKLDVGDQLVKNLKKNDGLDWHFVSKKDAEYGLSHKEYYMVITIPKDFSKNATTVLDKDPKKMELQYTTNDSLNYIGKVISEEGAKQVNAQVKETVSTSYADTVFGVIKQVGKGFNTAAKGSKQLSDGSKTLSDGINTYTAGVSQVNDGVIKLQTGVVPLGQGVLKLADGSNTLANGINTYTAGVDQVNNGVSQLQNGTGALASGVGQLATGSNTLNNGLDAYTAGVAQLNGGLTKLHANSDALRQGASDLAAGNQVLANTINSKTDIIINQLNSNDTKQAIAGLKQLKQHAPAIRKQLQELQNTMNGLPTLLGGINSSADKFSQDLTTNLGSAGNNISGSAKEVGEVLAANKDKLSAEDQQKLADAIAKNQAAGQNIQAAGAAAQTFKDQLTQAQNSLAQILRNAQQMQGYVTQVNALLEKLNTVDTSKLDELQGLTSQLEELKAGADKLATGSATLKSGVNEYTLGVDQAYAGANKLVANNQALTSGANQLAGGLGQLNAQVPTLTGGINQLASGTSQLAANSAALRSGASQLASGLGQMNAQVPTLTSGVNQLANGTQQLNANSPKLADGATQLEQGNSKLAKALAEGSEQVNDNTKNLSSKTSNMFASPTELKHKSYSYVPNYGYALAPYMLSVALYVGALVFNLVYPVRRLSDPDASATEWWLSKLSVGALVATGTSVVEVLLMMAAGLHPDHLGATLINAWFFALASTFIVMFLAVAFGNIGRFLGIIFLVIQLGSCGGSFPIQVTRAMGGFFQMVNPFLPMTYSVYGFRESLTSGLGANQVWISVGVQLIYIIASIALLWVAMNAERSKVTYVDVEAQNLND